jgi:predicted acyltransferase
MFITLNSDNKNSTIFDSNGVAMSNDLKPARYYALDALRGLTIAMMILVNTAGSWEHIYAPLEHADWNGFTPTDLVFPFFLFVVGSAMFFSFSKTGFAWSNAQGIKILRRTAIIFVIGLIFNAVLMQNALIDIRIMGVLQRIALAYAIAAVLVLCVSRTAIYIISVAILLGYWAMLVLGGGADTYGLQTNLVTHFDAYVLGPQHLWMGKGVPFDPEGLLSTLPSIVNVLIGFEVTRYITSQQDKFRSVLILIGVGSAALIVGLVWNIWMPINKSLWTSSFVVYTAGYFMILLAFFIWLIDVKGWDSIAKPLFVYGANPLFIYVLAAFWAHAYGLIPVAGEAGNLYQAMYLALAKFMDPLNASLAFALIHVGLFWLISLFLYKKKIFIKV